MTVKVVPIQSKMQKPTLAEVVSRLENLFNNYTLRGEDKLSVVLTSLSYCVWSLQKLVEDDDDKLLHLVDEILNQYVELGETVIEFTPDND
jgi:hypothetical protein|tara:strand:- start:6 stop:278 length:273 start_codon:yes stop_codon:yes gene_type:complete